MSTAQEQFEGASRNNRLLIGVSNSVNLRAVSQDDHTLSCSGLHTWSTYRAVSLKTLSMGTSPLAEPLDPATYESVARML